MTNLTWHSDDEYALDDESLSNDLLTLSPEELLSEGRIDILDLLTDWEEDEEKIVLSSDKAEKSAFLDF
jgi:hypothetical protein